MEKADTDIGATRHVARAVDWRARIRSRLANTQPQHAENDWILPGLSAHESRSYQAYFPATFIPAAVLIPIIEREEEITVLLTQRASQLKNHAGQISFPGGRIDPGDESARAGALREAWEEIGLAEEYVSVAGYLPDHIIVSGFRITPVVGFVRPGFRLLLAAHEVQDVFEVPVSYLFEPANHRVRMRNFGEREVEMCDIPYGKWNIWGATAGMLMTLYRLCIAADPESPLPADLAAAVPGSTAMAGDVRDPAADSAADASGPAK